MAITVDLDGLDRMIDVIGTDIEESVRPVAQAAAQVLYDEVKRNVAKIGKVTGNLDKSIYQVYSKEKSGPGVAVYRISWNANKAPHGHLLEYGHIRRYASYVGKDGQWHTAIRPEKQGTPKPRRKASQAEKDAYYVTLPGGPQQIAAQPFIRPALSKFPQASAAAEAKLLEVLGMV
jgi:hypothetical protein